MATHLQAQLEPDAGAWKTWFITSGKAWRLPPPAAYKKEIAEVLSRQQALDSAGRQQILYWNAGAPGYRWQSMVFKLWMSDTSYNGALAYMLLGAATYDATIAAWDTKYAYNRPRPFVADSRIKACVPKPESPSYPCEHSVAAGVAATLVAHFYPAMADSVNRLAQQVMASRVAAGVAFPDDTRAGCDLGKRIAEKEIERTKDFVPKNAWDEKVPQQPGLWKGTDPMFPLAGRSKTVALDSSSQFRPAPPPDFAQDMAELKNFKKTFRSQSNAFYYAGQTEDLLSKKIFEYNLHLNPPRAAISGVTGELYSYFFPAEKAFFQKKAKEGAESRFQGGIHFRTDNDTGLELGRNVAAKVIGKLKSDGADHVFPPGKGKKAAE